MAKNKFLSILNKVRVPNPPKSVFDLSYAKCGTMRFGEMVPTYIEHTVPGDVFEISQSAFVRLEPLSAPIMGNIQVDSFFFYVPFRIIWDDFEKFITGGRLGLDEPNLPFFKPFSFSSSEVLENFRLLMQLKQAFKVSSTTNYTYSIPPSSVLPWRAYWKIIDEYARDQNLIQSFFEPDSGAALMKVDSVDVDSSSSSSLYSKGFFKPFNGAWAKDVFTSALPFPQRGAAVTIPTGGDVSMVSSNAASLGSLVDTSDVVATANNGDLSLVADAFSGFTGVIGKLTSNPLNNFSIEDLREANVIQRWLEISAISGNRYKEAMLAHYGVDIRDERLQRPEYLGGMSTNVMISQVTQNSQTTDNSVLGDYAGHGLAAGQMQRRRFFCPEHGIIMGISVIRPTAVYSQGLNRNLLKKDKFDFYFPEFQNLGEQEIKLGELYATNDASLNDNLFGYGPRYYEYKMRHDEVFGDFDHGGLEYWVPQRKFSTAPALNADFVTVNPANETSLNNIFAVSDSTVDPFRVVFQNQVRAIRPMNKWSNFSLM